MPRRGLSSTLSEIEESLDVLVEDLVICEIKAVDDIKRFIL